MSTSAFTWLNKQGVRSNTGFDVQRIDRFTVLYAEEGKTVTVSVEPGLSAGRPVLCVSQDAFSKWDPPFGALEISNDKQRQLRENFVAAMEFQGMGVSIE